MNILCELKENNAIPSQNLTKELIISQKRLQVRKAKHCVHIIYTKLFVTCKSLDTFLGKKLTSYSFMFCTRFDCKVSMFSPN